MSSCDTSWNSRSAAGEWYRFVDQGVQTALGLTQSALSAYLRMLESAATRCVRLPGGFCVIPETQCPPRCTCTLSWETCRGTTVDGTLEVRNTGKTHTQFSLQAESFRTENSNSGVSARLDPDSFSLAPAAKQTVRVTIVPGDSFEPDRTYTAKVSIAGRYKDCALLQLVVHEPDAPFCTIEHGEIPTHIRAHHWFDHFQCEQRCFEPVTDQRDASTA